MFKLRTNCSVDESFDTATGLSEKEKKIILSLKYSLC